VTQMVSQMLVVTVEVEQLELPDDDAVVDD